MIRPKPLFPGARVALLGSASAVPEEKLQPALEYVRSLGLEPVVYPSCYFENRDGYFAASEKQRADELNHAFADDSIDGIWCIRGGYGAHRLQPLLDAELIRSHPKWLGGYSDITALHLFLNQVCDMEAYHCPMPSTEAFPDEFTLTWLKKALFGGLSGTLAEPDGQKVRTLVPGTVSGVLCGGNLSLLTASLGSPWEIDTKDKILFLEDIGEKPYRIDSMLTSLRNAGKFDGCRGIVLGAWTNCEADGPGGLELSDIFRQLIVPAGKPAVTDFACGHRLPTMSLPMGRMCTLDASAGTLTLNP